MADKFFKRRSVFGALGAATGLGNAYRFPALLSRYGYAFLISYALSLLFVCLPLLAAELGSVKGKKIPPFLVRAASVNSFIIALYYFTVTARLCAQAASVSVYLCLPAVALVLLLILKSDLSGLSGGASVISFFTLFTALGVKGVYIGGFAGCGVNFNSASFASGGMWLDALSQSFLSLSLAAGVMPEYARGLKPDFSPAGVAVQVVAINFFGCLLAAAGSAAGELTSRLASLALTVVAIHSTASLSKPLLSVTGLPAVFFPLAALALFPAFSSGATLAATDKMACSVTAVIIAAAHSAHFIFSAKGALGRIYTAVICLLLAAFALLSVCGARFEEYPSGAVMFASTGAVCVLLFALGRLTTLPQRCKLRLWKIYSRLKPHSKNAAFRRTWRRTKKVRRSSPRT